jgi:hypothetical protein
VFEDLGGRVGLVKNIQGLAPSQIDWIDKKDEIGLLMRGKRTGDLF